MTENAQSNAFATVVGRLGELSESELRQLFAIIGIRVGQPVPGAVAAPPATGNRGKPNASRGGKATRGKTSSRGGRSGNPQRKSQWANHPLYQEYRRLKSIVEHQAKESKLSFNAVRTGEARQYRTAFTHWMEAKSSFRGRGEGHEGSSDEESEEEEEGNPQEPPEPAGAAGRDTSGFKEAWGPGKPEPFENAAGEPSSPRGSSAAAPAKPTSPVSKDTRGKKPFATK